MTFPVISRPTSLLLISRPSYLGRIPVELTMTPSACARCCHSHAMMSVKYMYLESKLW